MARMRVLGATLCFLLSTGACNLLKSTADGAPEAGASASPAASASTLAAPSVVAKKSLDATSCDPGTSLNPPDKGKSFQSDQFRYTLLDARTDAVDSPLPSQKAVVLVKLQVENITTKNELNLSIADVDCSRDKAGPDRVRERSLLLSHDVAYPRGKMCVDLGGAITSGSFPPGAKAIGYYAFVAPEPLPTALYFDARNMSPDSLASGKLLKVAGSFRLR